VNLFDLDHLSLNLTSFFLFGFYLHRKSKNTISQSFYIHQHKPDFCAFYIICGGKQVLLRGHNDEGTMEDDEGVMVANMREKAYLRGWLGKMFADSLERHSRISSTLRLPNSQNRWENHV
jgi:hypothetical protein